MSDFGLSAIIKKEKCHSLSGTGTYLAPEVIQDFENEGHGESVDLWALGIFTYMLTTLECPFYSENRNELFEMICKETPPWEGIQDRISSGCLSFLKCVSNVIFIIEFMLVDVNTVFSC